MKIEVDKGWLNDLEESIVKLRHTLDEGVDTDDLISAAQSLVEDAEIILECAEDSSNWERQLPGPDDGEEEEDEPEEKADED